MIYEQPGAIVSKANTFRAPQTFASSGGAGLVVIEDIGQDPAHHSGAVILYATNGLGSAIGGSHQAWVLGIDQASVVAPNADIAISTCYAAGVSDVDGMYVSSPSQINPNRPASFGFGYAQPAESGALVRVKIAASGAGQSAIANDVTQGALQLVWVAGQTGDMLAIGSSNDSQQALRMRADGTIVHHATMAAATTSVTGVTNSTPAFTDANANFTASDVGRYFAPSSDIADGTYIQSVQSPTAVTLSIAAKTTNAAVSYTLHARSFQHRLNSGAPAITVHNATTPAVAIGTNLVVGPGASSPTNTLQVSQSGTATATIASKTPSWGSLQINANGTSPGDCTIWTSNSTALRLGSNGIVAIAADTSQNVIVGPGAKAAPAELATTATAALFYIPTMNGTPTGVPASLPTGAAPMVIDRTGNKLWFYIGGAWKGVAVA